MKTVRIHARPMKSRKKVVLWVEGARIPKKIVPCSIYAELEVMFYLYAREIGEKGYGIDCRKPNLSAAFIASRPVPKGSTADLLNRMNATMMKYKTITAPGFSMSNVPDPPPMPKEVEFETNMVEALEGWKKWSFAGERLWSMFSFQWTPCRAVEATCRRSTGYMNQMENCKLIPGEHHECGIYAANGRTEVEQRNGQIVGKIYGWGRYIRGETGWRSQFAYPKCFYLRADQEGLVEKLKEYRVPIYLDVSMRVYEPEEDGYDEYRQDTPEGSCGTVEVPSADQDHEDEEDE